MTNPTHADSINWHSSGAVGDLDEPHREVTGALSRMDGQRFWGYSLWAIPEGQIWGEIDLRIWPKEFLQSAGTAETMSIELRQIEAAGVAHQYAVGRPETEHVGEPSVPVTWADDHVLYAYPGEVYSAEEAAPVYLSYYDTGKVPDGYVLRELDLEAPQ